MQINKTPAQRSFTSDSQDEGFYYVYSKEDKLWYEVKLPYRKTRDASMTFVYEIFLEGLKFSGRYAIPIESIIILIDGKDFEGDEASRVAATAFLVLDIVQVGKIWKLAKMGKAALTGDKVIRKVFIDQTKEIGKEALIEFAAQLTVNLLIEMCQPNSKNADISMLFKKAYDKTDWSDIAIAASNGIKTKTKIIDEHINCIYSIYKNFQSYEDNTKATSYAIRDCLLPVFVDMGYNRISKIKFFSELKKAINEQKNMTSL